MFMKSLTAGVAAALFAMSGATAMASSDDRTHNDVSVLSVDQAAESVQVSSHGVQFSLDGDELLGVYVPLNVSAGDTLRLTYENGQIERIRHIN